MNFIKLLQDNIFELLQSQNMQKIGHKGEMVSKDLLSK